MSLGQNTLRLSAKALTRLAVPARWGFGGKGKGIDDWRGTLSSRLRGSAFVGWPWGLGVAGLGRAGIIGGERRGNGNGSMGRRPPEEH